MAGSFWETTCQPNPSRFRPHLLPSMLWDYSGGARAWNSSFSVDRARSLELHSKGVRCVPCACLWPGALLCPRRRRFSVTDT